MDTSGLEEEEEDDDWSRRVERDETIMDGGYDAGGGIPSTVGESEAASMSMIPPNGGTPATQQQNNMDMSMNTNMNMSMNMGEPNRLAPQREEPTLKEKLVERERQRRVEAEMARLKRQFALSSSHHNSSEDDDDQNHQDHAQDGGPQDGNDNAVINNKGGGLGGGGGALRTENGSVQGTMGDESSAHDGDNGEGPNNKEGEPNNKLTYPMERFLQEQGTVNQEESQQREHKRADTGKGVVMERFLKDPIVVEPSEPEPERRISNSVSFDMEPPPPRESTTQQTMVGQTSGPDIISISMPSSRRSHEASMSSSMEMNANASVGEVNNASIRNDDSENDDDEVPHNVGPSSSVSDSHLEVQQQHHHHDDDNEHEPYSPITADRDRPSSTTSSEPPPRVLRLTEAEIQEMAAIEEASIGNAPPSDRDDDDILSESSFVGELQTDFGPPPNHNIGVDPMMGGSLSQGTAATAAMDSASLVESNKSSPPSIDRRHDDHSLDDIDTGSEASSDDGNSVSVVANPPSERAPSEHERGDDDGEEEEEDVPTTPLIPDEMMMIHPSSSSPTTTRTTIDQLLDTDDSSERRRLVLLQDGGVARAPPQILSGLEDSPLDLEKSLAANAGVVNRQIRPGMLKDFKHKPAERGARSPASPMRRAQSMPDTLLTFDVDGFDYDKHDPLSPRSGLSDSIRDFPPDDVWSPLVEKMAVSPLHASRKKRPMPSPPSVFDPRPNAMGGVVAAAAGYGTLGGVLEEETPHIPFRPNMMIPSSFDRSFQEDEEKKDEGRPLLGVPRENSVRRAYISELLTGEFPLRSLVDDVFSDIRSVSTATESLQNYEAKEYLETNILARAFPERLVALMVTLMIEIPVIFIVLGGSDRLCMLIGRSKYQLLMGFLPLSSAISGNVGLQSSTLTTRAISHGHVTPSNYRNWLGKEVGAAVCLGFGMGTISACLAYWASNFDPVFAFAIMVAQFFSVVTAGVTGTFAPLVFTFIFNRDPGKWGGPLETAIQDIVGSFALVFLSYKILEFFGPLDIDPNDMCGEIKS